MEAVENAGNMTFIHTSGRQHTNKESSEDRGIF